MISKRKTTIPKTKSKEKFTLKEKELKPNNNQSYKLQPCPSKRSIKTGRISKEIETFTKFHNENENHLNFVEPKKEMYSKVYHRHSNSFEQIEIPFTLLRRSASAGGIKNIKRDKKSLSPTNYQQEKLKPDQKKPKSLSKTSIKVSKNKKNEGKETVKPTLVKKNETLPSDRHNKNKKETERSKINTHRVKTDGSSNVHENTVSKKTPKEQPSKMKIKRPKSKRTKEKDNSKEKERVSLNIKNSIYFSGSINNPSPTYSAIMTKENFHVEFDTSLKVCDQKMISAVVVIQKHFRGYLTRKIIEEFRLENYCAIKIQKAWRAYCFRKKLRKGGIIKKNLTIENSLITIKDFNSNHKSDKIKNKTCKFNFDEDSRDEEISSYQKERNVEEKEKYINILENLLKEDDLDEKFKEKIRTTLGCREKEKYVQTKIISEIISEKSFNSPREIKTPKSNIMINSPSSWSKSKPTDQVFLDNQLSQVFPSPCSNVEPSEIVFKRINSPSHKSATRSLKKLMMDEKLESKQEIKPFLTSFAFIEEFEFKIVDFFKDNQDIKEVFNFICKKSEMFKTNHILSEWNTCMRLQQFDDNFISSKPCPDYFPIALRETIMNENAMKIYLEDNDYFESAWNSNIIQKEMYEAYIRCIFDGLSEAIYHIYTPSIITNTFSGSVCQQTDHELFKVIFMNGLTLMQNWCEYICGAEIPVTQDDPNYETYCDRAQERVDVMIKTDSSELLIDYHAFNLWFDLEIGEAIFSDLVDELLNEM